MSVFEHLRPLVSLCQACGMIPFTMEENVISNKFVRFTFSFRHRTTWWFMVLFVLQFGLQFVMVKLSVSILDGLINDENVPMTVTILSGITMFSYTAQILLSRWIVLNYRKLRNAAKALQEVERLFGEKFIEQHQCFLGYRFIIAVTLIVTTVSFRSN
jgi:Kef-type K+ transport system membrane component KefB